MEQFEKYKNDREYYRLLLTIHRNIKEDIFPLLSKAEAAGKRLSVIGEDDEIVLRNVVIV